jgi:arsenate reductase (glutaredoxin)
MLKVYFKPNCATCQTALSILKKNTDEKLELVEYLVETPTQKEIKEILQMLGMKAEDLVRKKESLYKEKFEGKKISNSEWIKILVKNPILIERPIVVKNGKAIIGRPPEKILDIFKI